MTVFKYDRPMDPDPAMSKLADLAELFADEVDITNNGGPNQAMKATHIAKEVAGGLERAIYGLRMIYELSRSSNTGETRTMIEQTTRHALAALGERP